MGNIVYFVAVLILIGCSPTARQDPFYQEVTDKSGTNRLVLNYATVNVALFGSQEHEFKSLVWQVKVSSKWVDKAVVTKAAFQGTRPNERWISGVDSFDPASGVATIRVAEGDAPTNTNVIHYIYSWREWNLLTNGEVRLLRICKNPFEQYQKNE